MIQELTAQLRLYTRGFAEVKQDGIKDKDKAAKDDLINEMWKLAKASWLTANAHLIKAEKFALANQSGGCGETIQYSDYAKLEAWMKTSGRNFGLRPIQNSKYRNCLKVCCSSSGEKLAITEYIMDKLPLPPVRLNGDIFLIGK